MSLSLVGWTSVPSYSLLVEFESNYMCLDIGMF